MTLIKVGAGASGGGLDVVDHRVPPGDAPPLHLHTAQDEVFPVIDGRFAVTCGDEHWEVGRGSLVFLPRAVPDVAVPDPARIAAVSAAHGIRTP